MKISVIIPIYNMADSLESCIESITKQTYSNYEIVLVDDGSVDNSLEICKKYAEMYQNVVCCHQENQGSGPARNTGIKQATGDYLLFIDSDDLLENNALELLAKAAEDTKKDLYVFGYRIISKSGKIKERKYGDREIDGEQLRKDYSPYFGQVFEWGIQGAPWNKLFKAEIVKNNAVEYPALRRHQDEVFISRYVAHINNVCFISECLYTHYANDAKLMWRKYPKTYYEIVEQLYDFRKEIILPWNPENKKIEALIYSEYINNIFRACFRLFDPANRMNYSARAEWYKQNLYNRFELRECVFPEELLGRAKVLQNTLFVFFVKHRMTMMLDLLVKMRIRAFIKM